MSQFQLLHQGCISSVFATGGTECEHKVIKAYHKACDLQQRHWLNISREVTILTTLKDLKVPGVVQLQATHDDCANMCLVFEPCPGGDLYKRLAHCGLLKEDQLCKEVIIPLLKVLVSLHDLGIIHRDIKPENIFFDADGTLRLGDFGLAIRAPDRATSRVGTLDYMAPEVLAQPSPDMVMLRQLKPSQLPCYDSKIDIWALGVLVYESLMGIAPFAHVDPDTASLQAQFRKPAPLRPGVSAACADFVARVLVKQAAQRPTALQLLGHPWVQAYMDEGQAAMYSRTALQWFGSGSSRAASAAANIERVSSCPAAGSPENVTPDDTQLGVPGTGTARLPGTPSLCSLPTAKADKDSDRHRFINLSHFLQQTLKQPQEQAASNLAALALRQQAHRQHGWERKVQQHRQQQSRSGSGQTAFAAAAALAPGTAAGLQTGLVGVGQGMQRAAAMQRSTSACIDRGCAAAAGEEPSLATADITIPGNLPPAAAPAVAASVPNSAVLCCSTPVSPITDKARATYWLLSPQQQPVKQYQGRTRVQLNQQPAVHSGLMHSQLAQQNSKAPSILTGMQVYAGSKPHAQRPAVLIALAGAAAVPAGGRAATGVGCDSMQCSSSNCSAMAKCHLLGSPLPATQGDPTSPVGLSPIIYTSTVATPPAGSCFHMPRSPYRPGAAAHPAAAECGSRPHVAGMRGLVRHVDTGLLQLQLQQSTVPLVPRAHCAAAAAAPRPVQRELLQPIACALQQPSGQQYGSSTLLIQLRHQPSGASSISRASSRSSSRCSSSDSRSSSPEVPCGLDAELSPESCGNSPTYTAAEDSQLAAEEQANKDVPYPARRVSATTAAVTKCIAKVEQQDSCAELDIFSTDKQPKNDAAQTAAVAAALPVPAGGRHAAAAIKEESMALAKRTRARDLWKKVEAVCKMASKHRSMA